MDLQSFSADFVSWATSQPDIRGVVLVGSHARGTARPDSDLDLVILSDQPEALTSDTAWTRRFGQPDSVVMEDYGQVQSVRVHYNEGLEVEFGIASVSWAAVPVDEGTREVIAHGARILFDRDDLLHRLVAKCTGDDGHADWPPV